MPFLDKKTELNLPNINITEEMVRIKIMKLNANISCGPDKIHPQILIELVDIGSKPLAVLLYVSPIFKKGARNKAENYRLISLTSSVCKLMESFVKNSIITHMRAENLLSSKHCDFINGRSSSTQCYLILISAMIL